MVLKEAQQLGARFPVDFESKARTKIAKKVKCIALIKTLWYPEIVNELEKSARDCFLSYGVAAKNIHTFEVGGALELPLAAEMLAKKYDILVCLGCVVNGQTPHFDFVCKSAFDGLMSVQLKHQMPFGNGLLTVDNMQQAEARKLKGAEAAHAAFIQYFLKQKLKR